MNIYLCIPFSISLLALAVGCSNSNSVAKDKLASGANQDELIEETSPAISPAISPVISPVIVQEVAVLRPTQEKKESTESRLAPIPLSKPLTTTVNKPLSAPSMATSAKLLSGSVSSDQRSLRKQPSDKRTPAIFSTLESEQINDTSVLQPVNNERYKAIKVNRTKDPAVTPLSTFSIDVDTASFANVRRYINQGMLPPVDAVRTEEFINYFDYQYAQPDRTKNNGNALSTERVRLAYEMAPSPWNSKSKLLQITLQAKERVNQMGSNLVFLVDVSGSMASQNKLPLLKKSLHLLIASLNERDRISIIAYAGNAYTVLDSTSATDKGKLKRAVNSLQSGGGTNGSDGLAMAYDQAEKHFIKGGVNRILLATDGDFNLGMSDPSQMKSYIAKKRKTGVDLSVLGFGEGNYNDHLTQELSQAGNGNAAYIDSLQEAQKVLVQQAKSTFTTIAYDTKLQLEFNPKVVSRYRLLGYETRLMADNDFKNDKKDAGEVGSGQRVTALYEVTFNADATANALRYQDKPLREHDASAEVALIKMRYKEGHDKAALQFQLAVEQQNIHQQLQQSSDNFRLAAAAASYAEKLRGSDVVSEYPWQKLIALAESAKGLDKYGYRSQFVQQLRLSESLYH